MYVHIPTYVHVHEQYLHVHVLYMYCIAAFVNTCIVYSHLKWNTRREDTIVCVCWRVCMYIMYMYMYLYNVQYMYTYKSRKCPEAAVQVYVISGGTTTTTSEIESTKNLSSKQS